MKTTLKTFALVAIGVVIGRVVKPIKETQSTVSLTEQGLILKVS